MLIWLCRCGQHSNIVSYPILVSSEKTVALVLSGVFAEHPAAVCVMPCSCSQQPHPYLQEEAALWLLTQFLQNYGVTPVIYYPCPLPTWLILPHSDTFINQK